MIKNGKYIVEFLNDKIVSIKPTKPQVIDFADEELFHTPDEFIEGITKYCNGKSVVTISDIIKNSGLVLSTDRASRNRIAKVLRNLGFKNATMRIGGMQKKIWKKT